ncbi:hypothetical protein PRZ48_008930 [Zasmidium cellare]|uniref:SMODS and SLOG-associating 2TM effector domain-containing protein n=1 Tax=Zasmidium cellare TaxID=395010 RepID=A0ABR0EHJ3_ZASCE|nr:hypothetical protein PRZ48_008930 [Zasmidium cellare]
MAGNTIDIEKGMLSATTSPVENPSTDNQTPLSLFQLLIGIHTHPSLTHSAIAGSRTDNTGLYPRIKAEEGRLRIQYALTSYINNSLYMLQILLAATFTALSAYKDAHPQKGQGVPQRYRKARDQYAALLLEIESAERSFVTNDSGLDPRKEKERLQGLFDVARAEQQANLPDLYVSTEGHGAGEKERLERIERVLGELEGRLKGEGGK